MTGGTEDYGSAYVFWSTGYDGSGCGCSHGRRHLDDRVGQNIAMAGEVWIRNAFLVGAHVKDTIGEDAGGAYLMLDIGL